MQRGSQGRWQKKSYRVESDRQCQPNHSGDQASAQYTTAASLAARPLGIDTLADQCHLLTMMQVTQRDDEAEEDRHGKQPADQDQDHVERHSSPLYLCVQYML